MAVTPTNPHIRTVLFDLDGTLADTAPDLAFTLNLLLQEQSCEPLPYEMIRPHVSHGASAILRLGFPTNTDNGAFDVLRKRFLDIYEANLTRYTTLFPGMGELLEGIETRGMNWGVVTNKPSWLTDPLIEQLGLRQRAVVVVSGDTTARQKPHPEPVLFACKAAGSQAKQCLYVGDAERDIQAGNDAGMHTLVALFGYIGDGEAPENWGADGLVNQPSDIMAWIDRTAEQR